MDHFAPRLPGAVFLAGLALAACTNQPVAEVTTADDTSMEAEAALAENGKVIAEAQCSGCHAIGPEGASPREDAPPLRSVLAGYDPDALADDFREGIHVGHPDMPDFDFGPKGVDAVLAYLQTINPAP